MPSNWSYAIRTPATANDRMIDRPSAKSSADRQPLPGAEPLTALGRWLRVNTNFWNVLQSVGPRPLAMACLLPQYLRGAWDPHGLLDRPAAGRVADQQRVGISRLDQFIHRERRKNPAGLKARSPISRWSIDMTAGGSRLMLAVGVDLGHFFPRHRIFRPRCWTDAEPFSPFEHKLINTSIYLPVDPR